MKSITTSILIMSTLQCFSQPVSNTNTRLEEFDCNIVSTFNTGSYGVWGLDWDEGFLWASFNNLSNQPYLFKLDTQGNHIDSIALPNASSNAYADIEVSGNNLWIVQESAGLLLKIDLTTQSIVQQDTLPDNGFDENYFSVAYDGQFLYVMNYSTADNKQRLFKADPNTLALLDSVDLAHYIVVLEMIGNELWGVCGAGLCFPDVLFRIDPATGTFIDSSDWCLGTSLFGMAWDGAFLWESAGLNHDIYKVDIGFVGIPDVQPLAEAMIFPNPVNDQLTISFSDRPNGSVHVQLINTLGEVVVDRRVPVQNKKAVIDLVQVTSGMYLVKLEYEERLEHQMVIID